MLPNGDLVRVLKIALPIAILLYFALMALFFAQQRSLLYYPRHTWVPLEEAHADPAYKQISVRTADGIDLKAWYAPATTKPFTIVFFHGNADNLYSAAQVGNRYIAQGYGFLAAEYRGYSGLPGKPTESGLYADGRAYLSYLITSGVHPSQLILFGQSLGTGVATQMAADFPVGGVMLLAPFLSIPKVAQAHFPIFPCSLLAVDRYDNAKKIKNVHAPILIINGSADDIVPPLQGLKLYSLANEPREFHSIENRGHNDILDDFEPLSEDWLARISLMKDGPSHPM